MAGASTQLHLPQHSVIVIDGEQAIRQVNASTAPTSIKLENRAFQALDASSAHAVERLVLCAQLMTKNSRGTAHTADHC